MKLPQAARRCWESGGVVSPPMGLVSPPRGLIRPSRGVVSPPKGLQEPNSNARKKKVEKRTTADTISGFHAAKIVRGWHCLCGPPALKSGGGASPRIPHRSMPMRPIEAG